jgi:hypothetical protein
VSAPELKYTERDVRENPNLYDAAMDYLEEYAGDFEFLLDCKERYLNSIGMSNGMIKGILNCMRVDPRWRGQLPEPLKPEPLAEVIPMTRKSRARTYEEMPECPLKVKGIFHHHKRRTVSWGYKYCYGLYRINREIYSLPARLHVNMAVGKSPATNLVHKAVSASFEWLPPHNQEGWLYRGYGPTLWVATGCKYPTILKDPILLRQEHITDYNMNMQSWKDVSGWYKAQKKNLVPLLFCLRCFPEGS